MNTTSFAAASLVAAFFAMGAQAQTPAPGVTPSQAPVVAASTPAAPASAPNQVVYAQRLPSAAELSSAAAGQGMTVERIEQNASQVTAVYTLANGQRNTVLYQLLPPAGAPAPTAVVPVSPAPATTTVVYERAPRVIYYDDYDPYYYPRYWHPPVSLSFGFGHWSHRGHHHHHHHHRGHWRR